jgi:hypothetical protein
MPVPPARGFLTALIAAARDQGGSTPTWLLAVASALVEASGTSVDLARSRLAELGDLAAAGRLLVPALPGARTSPCWVRPTRRSWLTHRRAWRLLHAPSAVGLVRLALPSRIPSRTGARA